MARRSNEHYDHVRAAVASSQLPPPARLLIHALCFEYQDKSPHYPSTFRATISTLRQITGIARSTTAEYVVALEEAGWLDRSVRPWDVTIGSSALRLRETIPDHVREQVTIRDGYACRRCGVTSELTVDHVIPWSKGGTDDLDNLQLLCRPCNSSKGARI